MTEADVEIILQQAREKFPDACPRIISDNGPQYIAKDFKEFIRLSGMTHVRASPFYPESNGKFERFNQSLKAECIRRQTPLSLDDARKVVQRFVDHYNNVRLHSYIAPKDKLEGRAEAILAKRDRRLAVAREACKAKRKERHLTDRKEGVKICSAGETEAGSAGEQPATVRQGHRALSLSKGRDNRLGRRAFVVGAVLKLLPQPFRRRGHGCSEYPPNACENSGGLGRSSSTS